MATNGERRARLLRAIEAGDVVGIETDYPPQHGEDEQGRRGGWWEHLLTHFFGGDEDVMFTDLRMNRRVFTIIVSALDDIQLARRGRRGFVFSHQERVLFLHVYLAFGIDVLTMLVTPRIKTACEINRIAKAICEMYRERLS